MQSITTTETKIIGPNAVHVSRTAREVGMIYEFSRCFPLRTAATATTYKHLHINKQRGEENNGATSLLSHPAEQTADISHHIVSNQSCSLAAQG